jgi:DUF4097 and DUF4098 domain-containing protein YvlB
MHFVMIVIAALQTQTDSTLNVPTDTRLEVTLSAGSIVVSGWNRPDVQVTGKTAGRTRLNIVLDGGVLRVTGREKGGVDVADVVVNVPKNMSVKLGTGDVDVTVKDTDADVSVLNYRGTIDVTGGRGTISLKSTLGEVKVRSARGHVRAEATYENVTLEDVIGDVDVSSSSKHVTLTRVDSRNLNAQTVAGVIRFSGPLHADGRYAFATHMGSIWATVTNSVNATVSVATVSGAFSSALPYRVTDRRRQGIFTAVFGNGKAVVEMETFAGAMVIRE